MPWLGIDIGGANLKVADGNGFALALPFALWKEHQRLAQELRTLIAESPPVDHLAITMTGELADCFESKAAGVRFILEAVIDAAGGRHARVYLGDGKLVTPQVALMKPLAAAASNWHALARFAGRFVPNGPAMLLDVGSTTCDLIPLFDGQLKPTAFNDTDRLLAGELVYTGIERSPICAVTSRVPYRGRSCRVAQEYFATTQDAYVILCDLPEDATHTSTADNRPLTKTAARTRLSRVICADDEQFNHRDAVLLAEAVAEAQAASLVAAWEQVAATLPAAPAAVVLSGHGEFLARRVLGKLPSPPSHVVSLADVLDPFVSRCAPAHAVAVLAREASGKP